MKNLSKYVTLNLLSILSCIIFIFLLISIPISMYLDAVSSEEESYNLINLVVFIGPFVYLYPLFEILTVFLSFFEFLIYKFKKIEPVLKIPSKYNKIHLTFFIIGILLSFIPLVIVYYIFSHPL